MLKPRPLALLLITLLCLTGAYPGAPLVLKCASPLIDGPKDSAGLKLYTFSGNSKELQCNDGKEIEIVSGEVRYQKLLCTESGGWVDSTNINKVAFGDLAQKLIFKCETKILQCDNPLIDGPKIAGQDLYTYTTLSKELQCTDDKEIEHGGNRYAKLKCDEDNGWLNPMSNDKLIFGDLTKKIIFICVEKLKCDESLIKGPRNPANNERKFTYSDTNELKCNENNKDIFLSINGKWYAKLVCNEDLGWTNPDNNGEIVIRDASQEIGFNCVLKEQNEKDWTTVMIVASLIVSCCIIVLIIIAFCLYFPPEFVIIDLVSSQEQFKNLLFVAPSCAKHYVINFDCQCQIAEQLSKLKLKGKIVFCFLHAHGGVAHATQVIQINHTSQLKDGAMTKNHNAKCPKSDNYVDRTTFPYLIPLNQITMVFEKIMCNTILFPLTCRAHIDGTFENKSTLQGNELLTIVFPCKAGEIYKEGSIKDLTRAYIVDRINGNCSLEQLLDELKEKYEVRMPS